MGGHRFWEVGTMRSKSGTMRVVSLSLLALFHVQRGWPGNVWTEGVNYLSVVQDHPLDYLKQRCYRNVKKPEPGVSWLIGLDAKFFGGLKD